MVAHYVRTFPKAGQGDKRRVSLHIILNKGQRAGDPDSYQKSLLDALVNAEMLWDDNHQHVEIASVTFSHSPAAWGTVITLQDL
jgi:Holliday junction resolvase RusA-like endonuclease